MRRAILSAALPLLAAATPSPQTLAPGVAFVPGTFEPGRQPDGNSLVLAGPRGVVVVDTGRHAAHRARIAAAAAATGKPVVAIVNTHWHLDHVSGNPALKAADPVPRVYASSAIDGALAGFLKRSAEGARAALAGGKLDPAIAEDVRGDLNTVARGSELRPDVVVGGAMTVAPGGRRLSLRLAQDAATAGDVWLIDRASGIAAVGDLVTLPAPFLDTACPDGWRRALGDVAAARPRLIVPGHGAPMTPAEFGVWRAAFGRLLDCAQGSGDAAACADGWVRDLGALLPPDEAPRARRMTAYYVRDVLRTPGGWTANCVPPAN